MLPDPSFPIYTLNISHGRRIELYGAYMQVHTASTKRLELPGPGFVSRPGHIAKGRASSLDPSSRVQSPMRTALDSKRSMRSYVRNGCFLLMMIGMSEWPAAVLTAKLQTGLAFG